MQRKSECKLAFTVKWSKYTYDLLASSGGIVYPETIVIDYIILQDNLSCDQAKLFRSRKF